MKSADPIGRCTPINQTAKVSFTSHPTQKGCFEWLEGKIGFVNRSSQLCQSPILVLVNLSKHMGVSSLSKSGNKLPVVFWQLRHFAKEGEAAAG